MEIYEDWEKGLRIWEDEKLKTEFYFALSWFDNEKIAILERFFLKITSFVI